MRRRGYKIVGVSTSRGGLYNKDGIDIEALSLHYQRERTLEGFPGSEASSSAELLVADCDILIPAATENQITSRNAEKVRARVLCEGANGPTTAEADDILVDKGVFVIPDILANSGGVTVSYFEWVQDRQGYFWTESMVNDHLHHTMKTAFAEVLKYAETHKVSNRIAAYMLALDRWHTRCANAVSTHKTGQGMTPTHLWRRVATLAGRGFALLLTLALTAWPQPLCTSTCCPAPLFELLEPRATASPWWALC
jgi:glutamate dehydrogenase/leucine dehydrogenase